MNILYCGVIVILFMLSVFLAVASFAIIMQSPSIASGVVLVIGIFLVLCAVYGMAKKG